MCSSQSNSQFLAVLHLLALLYFKCFSEHCYQVFWDWAKERSQCCALSTVLVSHHCHQVVFSLPLLTTISLWEISLSSQCTLPSSIFSYVLPVISRDLKSQAQRTAPKQWFRGELSACQRSASWNFDQWW